MLEPIIYNECITLDKKQKILTEEKIEKETKIHKPNLTFDEKVKQYGQVEVRKMIQDDKLKILKDKAT